MDDPRVIRDGFVRLHGLHVADDVSDVLEAGGEVFVVPDAIHTLLVDR